jgi:hypothetical protein
MEKKNMKKSFVLLSSLVLAQLASGAEMTATATAPNPTSVKLSSSANLESGNSLTQGSLKKTEKSTGFMELILGLSDNKYTLTYLTRASLGDRGAESEQKYFFGRNELIGTYILAGSDALSLTGVGRLNLGDQDNASVAGSQRLGLSVDSTTSESTILGKVTPYAGVGAYAQRTLRPTEVVGLTDLTAAEKASLDLNSKNQTMKTNTAARMEYTIGTTLVPSGAEKLTLGAEIFVRRQYNPVYTLTDKKDSYKTERLASATTYSYLELLASLAPTKGVSVYSKVSMDITTAENKVLLRKLNDAENKPNPISVALGVKATIL